MRLVVEVLDGELAVARLPANAGIPTWLDWGGGPLASVTRTADELSIVAPSIVVPADAQAERGWRAIRLRGPLPFSMTGVLHRILTPLADARVSVFTLATYDTDYVLVRAPDLPRAVAALRPGFDVIAPET
jgi:hypothetical protein